MLPLRQCCIEYRVAFAENWHFYSLLYEMSHFKLWRNLKTTLQTTQGFHFNLYRSEWNSARIQIQFATGNGVVDKNTQ